VQNGVIAKKDASMSRSIGEKQTPHRISVSLTDEQYNHMVRIAEEKRVSLAWVIRDTIDKLIVSETPLFNGQNNDQKR